MVIILENNLAIDSCDNHYIYGTLTKSIVRSKSIAIFVHGLAGESNHHLFFNGSGFLAQHGFDAFRFDLTSQKPKGRSFREASLESNAQDVNSVLEYFSSRYPEQFLIGHSLGCPVILLSNHHAVRSTVFWEPSRPPRAIFGSMDFTEDLDGYFLESNVGLVLGRTMVEEGIISPTLPRLLRDLQCPLKIITASKKGLRIARTFYQPHIATPEMISCIGGSSHTFDDIHSEKTLFNETLEWLKQF